MPTSKINLYFKTIFLTLQILTCSILMFSCATNVVVNERLIESNEIPAAFDNYTIIFISDIHINDLLSEKYFLRVAKLIEKNSPDLILLGGDYIDADTKDIDKAFEILGKMVKTDTIAVLGNHDNRVSHRDVKNRLLALDIVIVDNSLVRVFKDNQSIVISGLADDYSDTIEIEQTLSNVRENDFCILLSHSPEPYKIIRDDTRVDLMLSGHTHGGQVTFFGLWAPILPLRDKTYWRGVYKSENNQLIITNGIGVYQYPIRVFARPGIETIILKRIN